MVVIFLLIIIIIMPTVLVANYLTKKNKNSVSDTMQWIRKYIFLKNIINLIITIIVFRTLGRTRFLRFFQVLYLILLSFLDNLILYYPIKSARKLEISLKDYIVDYIKQIILSIGPIIAFMAISSIIECLNKEYLNSDIIWFISIALPILIVQQFYSLLMKWILKARHIEKQHILYEFIESAKEKYKIDFEFCIFDSRKQKMANAFAADCFNNKNDLINALEKMELMNKVENNDEIKGFDVHPKLEKRISRIENIYDKNIIN